jgi:hypothetical protein
MLAGGGKREKDTAVKATELYKIFSPLKGSCQHLPLVTEHRSVHMSSIHCSQGNTQLHKTVSMCRGKRTKFS